MALGLTGGAAIAAGALGGAALGAGVGMLTKPSMPKPKKMNVGQSISDYVLGMNQALPSILSGEQQYVPQFTANNLGTFQDYLNGVNGQLGFIGQSGAAQQASQQQINALRGQDITGQMANVGGVRGLLQSISPEQAAQVNQATQLANQAYQRAQFLSPEQQRLADQSAMEMSSQRGRLNDQSSIASQILNRESTLSNNMSNAMTMGQNAYNQAQQFYQQPGLNLLGQTPMAYNAGVNYMNAAGNMLGKSQPQLYDVGAALNLGATNTANQNNFALTKYQGGLAQSQAMMGMIGNVAGAALKAGSPA